MASNLSSQPLKSASPSDYDEYSNLLPPKPSYPNRSRANKPTTSTSDSLSLEERYASLLNLEPPRPATPPRPQAPRPVIRQRTRLSTRTPKTLNMEQIEDLHDHSLSFCMPGSIGFNAAKAKAIDMDIPSSYNPRPLYDFKTSTSATETRRERALVRHRLENRRMEAKMREQNRRQWAELLEEQKMLGLDSDEEEEVVEEEGDGGCSAVALGMAAYYRERALEGK